MPSITYWNRLEPRPRARDLLPSLAARVRDPLWFLARQYQMGEFHGEDAGSPAYVRLSMRQTPFTGWRVNGGEVDPIDGTLPLEEMVETEAYTDHAGMKVELGQLAETVFVEQGLIALVPTLRRGYLTAFSSEEDLARNPDPETASFLRVTGGRAIDGVTLFREAEASAPDLPQRLTVPPSEIPPGDRIAAAMALAAFRGEVLALYGDIGRGEAPAWNPERLEYGSRPSLRLQMGRTPCSARRRGATATSTGMPSIWTGSMLPHRKARGPRRSRSPAASSRCTCASPGCRTIAGGISRPAARISAPSSPIVATSLVSSSSTSC